MQNPQRNKCSTVELPSSRVLRTVPYLAAYHTYYCCLLLYACAPLIDGLGHAALSATYMYLVHRGLSQASCMIVTRFRAALDLDIHVYYPLSNLIRSRWAERAKPGRGKPVLIMHTGFLACFHAISLERSRFSKITTLIFIPF